MKMEQVLYINLETTDLIQYDHDRMPWIIELAFHYGENERYSTLITPPVEDFDIHPKATEVHSWTKEALLEKDIADRPTFD